jgi:sialate O-acetylesterase
MVLQRAPQRAIVWGYTDTFNAKTTLTMNGKVYHTKSSSSPANKLGESIWSVTLDPQPEEGPFKIHVNQPLPNGTLVTLTLDDVLFGDVWVCSGQSNMQFSVGEMLNASVEIENARKYPKIRLLTTLHNQSGTPEEELLGIGMNWTIASPTSVGSGYTSAVCWLFGRMVYDAIGGRPMGLVHSSWGATEIEFWTPPQALKDCGIDDVGIIVNNSVLYNAMIHPFTRMAIKGALWYQGKFILLNIYVKC